jgi:hypothetical protein
MRRIGVVLVLTGLVSGCGSSSLSAKDYRAKADAICTTIRSERDRLPGARDLEQLRAVARSTLAINTDAVRRFKDLDPPGDLSDQHDVIVKSLQDTVKLQQKALRTKATSDAMRTINIRAGEARAKILKAAEQAKLPACGRL